MVNPGYAKVDKLEGGNLCIVLNQYNKLGDLIMNNHFLLNLKGKYNLTCVVTDEFFVKNKEFLENHCVAGDCLVFPKSSRRRLAFIRQIKRRNIGGVVLFTHSPKLIEVFFFLAGVPVIAGIRGWAELLTHCFDVEALKDQEHFTTTAYCIQHTLGVRKQVTLTPAPYFPFRLTGPATGNAAGEILMAVHTSGQTYWMRRWPQEKYIEVCKMFLARYPGKILLVGGKEEHGNSEAIKNRLIEDCNAEGRVQNCCGESLNTAANVLSSVDVYLGNDSGPMHLATALKKARVICIFGPSNIRYVNPTAVDRKNVTIASELACAPCLADTCALAADKQYSCLNDLPTRKVWEKLTGVIEEIMAVKHEAFEESK